MSIPRTPARYRQRSNSDPFSSPARGVCWSPGASATLLDDLYAFRSSTDLESVLDTNVSPVRRSAQGARGPFAPLQHSSDSQFQDSESISGDLTRFLASPVNPSSPPSIPRSSSTSSLLEHSNIVFYGAGLGGNELDKHYQLASPASGASLLSHSPASQSFHQLSSEQASSIANISSPVFPPPATPPLFTHTFSQNDQLSSPLPSPAPTSTYNYGRAMIPLPPSSPPPDTSSSSPFEQDPFVVPQNQRTGKLDIIDDTYQLPTVEPDSTGPMERRGRIYSSRNPFSAAKTGSLGVTKEPHPKSKAPVRGQRRKLRPIAPAPPASTSSSDPHVPYLSPVSSTHTPAPARPFALYQDICATSSTQPADTVPSGLTSAQFCAFLTTRSLVPSQDRCATTHIQPTPRLPSNRFMFPTPATTISLATPSTATASPNTPPFATSLNTPGLLDAPAIADPYSTPEIASTYFGSGIAGSYSTAANKFVSKPQGEGKRERFTRFLTPSPVSVPEHVRELVANDRGDEKTAGRDVCSSIEDKSGILERVEMSSNDCVAYDESIASVPSTGSANQSLETVGSIPRLERGKRAREEVEGDSSKARATKKAKENTNVLTGGEVAQDETSSDRMEIAFARSTRSQTRGMAALLASDALEAKDANEHVEVTPPLQPSSPTPQTPRTTRSGRPFASGKMKVTGRAPSRVVIDDENNALEEVERDEAKESEGGPDVEEGGSTKAAASENKHTTPADLLPRPNAKIVFDSSERIKQRTFPKHFPIHAGYEGWYRRFPVSAYFMNNDPANAFVLGDKVPSSAAMRPRAGRSGAAVLIPNKARHFNLYTPRFVRGVGTNKVGLCPICVEPVWRGGEGKTALFNTKISAFNYHMQYHHGISCQTGLPFSPPVAFRHATRKAAHPNERTSIEEGKCHSCRRWTPIESVKYTEIMVPEINWWKHAASCHGNTRIEGDRDIYIEDNVYTRLRQYESTAESEIITETGGEQKASLVKLIPEGAGQGITALDKSDMGFSMSSGSSQATTDEKRLQESQGVLGSLFGTESDSDLTDLGDDG